MEEYEKLLFEEKRFRRLKDAILGNSKKKMDKLLKKKLKNHNSRFKKAQD